MQGRVKQQTTLYLRQKKYRGRRLVLLADITFWKTGQRPQFSGDDQVPEPKEDAG